MEFIETLNALAAKIRQQAAAIQTEEATKNAFVMLFIHTVLGYDVFDPTEVTPELVGGDDLTNQFPWMEEPLVGLCGR